jgi:predicted PurR-regulated permease PerM
VILAVGALIAVGVTLYKNWDTFTANLEAIWQTFSANIKNWTKILVDSIKFYWTNLRMNLNAIMQAIVDMVKRMGENIVSFFKNL